MERTVRVLAVVGFAVMLCIVVAACGPAATEFLSPQTPQDETGEKSEESVQDPQVTALVDEAKVDLSESLGVPVESIDVVSVEEVEWRDSSLGCPQPGSASLTVITPGYLITLEAEGDEYEYHTDYERVVTCDDPQPPYRPEPAQGTDMLLVAAAKADLAQKLGISEDQIEVVRVTAQEWSDASLGCPQSGMMYAQVITSGYQIILSAEGQTYDYRTDGSSVRLCEQ